MNFLAGPGFDKWVAKSRRLQLSERSRKTAIHYRVFRRAGYLPKHAMSAARTLYAWEHPPVNGECWRIVVEDEQESYFDVFGESIAGYTNQYGKDVSAEEARKEIVDRIDRLSCVTIIGEFWDCECGRWVTASACGMVIEEYPDCPYRSPYVTDIMDETMRAFDSFYDDEEISERAKGRRDEAMAMRGERD